MKPNEILNEGISQQDLADVLFRRLEARYPDIVTNHGHEVVGDAVQNVASFHAGAEELGTSDIGIMLREIMKQLDQSANKIDEEGITEAVPPTKPDPFVFKSLNAADAYFRAVTHGDGMDVVTRYGKGDAGAYRQYLSKFVKPELDEQDWSTLPGHGSQKDTFSFDKWKNEKPVQKNDPASRLAAMSEPMVADWYADGGYDSVRNGLIDMANDRRIRWSTEVIDQALHILNIAPDNEFELTETPGRMNTDLSTLANKLLRGNAIKWKKEGQGLALKLNLSIDQQYSILPKVTDRLKKLGFTVKKQEHQPDLGYKMPTSNTTEYSNGECKITVYVGRDYRREKNPVILNIIPNGQTEGLEEDHYEDSWAKKKAAANKATQQADKAELKAAQQAHWASKDAEREQQLDQFLARMARNIEDFTGQTFPDVDPYEMLAQKYRTLDERGQLMKYLDAAARKHLGEKSYNDYLKNFYDQQALDNPEVFAMMGGKGNPFNESSDEGLKFGPGGYPDVDHMNGPSSVTSIGSTDDTKSFTDQVRWQAQVDKINSEVFDDNSEFISNSMGQQVVHDGITWAEWKKSGYGTITLGPARKAKLQSAAHSVTEDGDWKEKTWDEQRAEAIASLESRIRKAINDSGWNDAGMYDRYWKKEVAKMKKQLAAMKRGEGEHPHGIDLDEDTSEDPGDKAAFSESKDRPRVRKYTKERPDGTMMVRYEVLDDRGYRIPGQGPEGFDDRATANKFLRAKSFELMRETNSGILKGVQLK